MHASKLTGALEMNLSASVQDEQSDSSWADGNLQLEVRVIDLLSDYTVSGELVGFTPGEVAILVDESLSEQREVAVHFAEFSFEGQTLYCRPNGNRYEAHVSIDDIQGIGLRRTPRFPVMIPAKLLLPDVEPVAITIRDLSRDGMGILSPVLLKAGQPIAIVSGPAFVFAVVRHCQETTGGLFRAGVEMHHLFERPPQSESEQGQAAANGLFRKTFRLFSRRAVNPSDPQDQLRQLGVTEVGS